MSCILLLSLYYALKSYIESKLDVFRNGHVKGITYLRIRKGIIREGEVVMQVDKDLYPADRAVWQETPWQTVRQGDVFNPGKTSVK